MDTLVAPESNRESGKPALVVWEHIRDSVAARLDLIARVREMHGEGQKLNALSDLVGMLARAETPEVHEGLKGQLEYLLEEELEMRLATNKDDGAPTKDEMSKSLSSPLAEAQPPVGGFGNVSRPTPTFEPHPAALETPAPDEGIVPVSESPAPETTTPTPEAAAPSEIPGVHEAQSPVIEAVTPEPEAERGHSFEEIRDKVQTLQNSITFPTYMEAVNGKLVGGDEYVEALKAALVGTVKPGAMPLVELRRVYDRLEKAADALRRVQETQPIEQASTLPHLPIREDAAQSVEVSPVAADTSSVQLGANPPVVDVPNWNSPADTLAPGDAAPATRQAPIDPVPVEQKAEMSAASFGAQNVGESFDASASEARQPSPMQQTAEMQSMQAPSDSPVSEAQFSAALVSQESEASGQDPFVPDDYQEKIEPTRQEAPIVPTADVYREEIPHGDRQMPQNRVSGTAASAVPEPAPTPVPMGETFAEQPVAETANAALDTPEITEGLNSLLAGWKIFSGEKPEPKKEGLIKRIASRLHLLDREEAEEEAVSGEDSIYGPELYQKLAGLSLDEVLSGRWDTGQIVGDSKVAEDVRLYVEGWEGELGPEFGLEQNLRQPFETYLRTVIAEYFRRQAAAV